MDIDFDEMFPKTVFGPAALGAITGEKRRAKQ